MVRQKNVDYLADQVIAENAVELIFAELPSVKSAVVDGSDDCADVAAAELPRYRAVVVEQLAHGQASLVRVGVGVRDGHCLQEPAEVMQHQLVEAVPLECHHSCIRS